MASMTPKAAVAAIEKHGILLVYPIDNRKEPPSLWSVFHPRTPMRWEWDQEGDDRVARLWQLREALSRSGQVVYAKWYRGRATFFSRDVFAAMLSLLGSSSERGGRGEARGLSAGARRLLGLLEMDSPLSTKELKALADMRGKAYEPAYEKALKELWASLRAVGYGERDDGAFPSLLVGATKNLFEDLWESSKELSADEAWAVIRAKVPGESLFLKQLGKMLQTPHVDREREDPDPRA